MITMSKITIDLNNEIYDNPWMLEGNPFTSDMIGNNYGFVYLLENTSTKRKYIGKKFFWNKKILPKTKTRRRRKHVKVESDWKNYYGSSEEFKKDLELLDGLHYINRTIIRLCKSKGECSYYETKEQFDKNALLSEDYYNNFIGLKVHRKHIL